MFRTVIKSLYIHKISNIKAPFSFIVDSLYVLFAGDFRNVICCTLPYPKPKPSMAKNGSENDLLKKWAMW